MRTEQQQRSVASGTNALASSILITCRPRQADAPANTFRKFQADLAAEMPSALSLMTGRDRDNGSLPWVDPIDLRQAAIGPGMAAFTRCALVQKANGTALSIVEALQEINEAVDRYFEEMEGALDPASGVCVQWYREYAFGHGPYGRAQTLCMANNLTPEALAGLGLLEARGGQVNLLRPELYTKPMDSGPSIWELCHRLVLALKTGGEAMAGLLYNRMPSLAEEARDLAYRLYLEAEKKTRAEDALGYNALVASWTDIRSVAARLKSETQGRLGG